MAMLTMSQLQQALRTSLEQVALDRPAAEQAELVKNIVQQFAAGTGPVPDHERRIDNAVNSDLAYAIPDDALNLFPSMVQAAIGAFAKGPIGALSDIVGLLLRYRSLRVELSAEEAAVLRVLREAKTEGSTSLAPADIQDRLKSKQLRLRQPLGGLLAGLAAKKTERATLVREANGRWTIGNV